MFFSFSPLKLKALIVLLLPCRSQKCVRGNSFASKLQLLFLSMLFFRKSLSTPKRKSAKYEIDFFSRSHSMLYYGAYVLQNINGMCVETCVQYSNIFPFHLLGAFTLSKALSRIKKNFFLDCKNLCRNVVCGKSEFDWKWTQIWNMKLFLLLCTNTHTRVLSTTLFLFFCFRFGKSHEGIFINRGFQLTR